MNGQHYQAAALQSHLDKLEYLAAETHREIRKRFFELAGIRERLILYRYVQDNLTDVNLILSRSGKPLSLADLVATYRLRSGKLIRASFWKRFW
jgi:hypothetical protein